jgi:hypothetical protein
MRHPAAPIIIAVLLGFLTFMVLWARWRGDGHHEGNPHPNDVPTKRHQSDPETHNANKSNLNKGSHDEDKFDDVTNAEDDCTTETVVPS